jgi:hypothetical protein
MLKELKQDGIIWDTMEDLSKERTQKDR